MQNPFTHTPGIAGNANIPTMLENEIYENFKFTPPSEHVYKIIGVRGSGKTVILGNVMRYYRAEEQRKDGWLVYELSSSRNPVKSMISYMMMEPEISDLRTKGKVDFSFTVPILGLNVSAGLEDEDISIYDEEVVIEKVVETLVRKKKKILIGIDDIAKTPAMTEFCSIYAKLIRKQTDEGYPWPVYLICSGVYENYYDLGEVDNLTFFKRAAEIKTVPLSTPDIALKYETTLAITESDAIKYAKETRGFAYAYQVFGSNYFQYKNEGIDYIKKAAKSELFSQCYEKIWKELPKGEKELLRIIASGTNKRHDIMPKMNNGKNYQVYSTKLKNMGILIAENRGEVQFTLPYFDEYIQKYGD